MADATALPLRVTLEHAPVADGTRVTLRFSQPIGNRDEQDRIWLVTRDLRASLRRLCRRGWIRDLAFSTNVLVYTVDAGLDVLAATEKVVTQVGITFEKLPFVVVPETLRN